jgi:hypothetical protein
MGKVKNKTPGCDVNGAGLNFTEVPETAGMRIKRATGPSAKDIDGLLGYTIESLRCPGLYLWTSSTTDGGVSWFHNKAGTIFYLEKVL